MTGVLLFAILGLAVCAIGDAAATCLAIAASAWKAVAR